MPSQKYAVTEKNIMPWAKKHPCLMRYINKLNAHREGSAQNIYLFCDWAQKTPEELLNLKCDYTDIRAEQLLDDFVGAPLDIPDSRKLRIVNCVKGFFRQNYRRLESAAGKIEVTPVKETNSITKENRLRIYKNCLNPRDKALVLMGLTTAIALETMSLLRWSHFEPDWQEREIPHISIEGALLKGHGKGKYRGVRQETFCTPETRIALIEYREYMERIFGYTWRDDDYVFMVMKNGAVTPMTCGSISQEIFMIAKRAGVKYSIHDGRRIVQTALENIGCSVNWVRKVKGRKVKGEDSPYSKPAIEQLRNKYREALPELEFLNPSIPTVNPQIEQIQTEKLALEGKVARLEAAIAEIREAFNQQQILTEALIKRAR